MIKKKHPYVDVHGLTITGDRHDSNHDHFAIAALQRSVQVSSSNLAIDDGERVRGDVQGRVFVVADGVSGGPAPARASRHAIRGVVDYLVHDLPWDDLASSDVGEVLVALEQAMHRAQEHVRLNAGDARTPGTTLTLAFVVWPDLYVAHVGDSRCYVRRGADLVRMTTDHTLAAIRNDEDGEGSNILWNVVGGGQRELHPEVHHAELRVGDTLVLVTDGVLEGRTIGELKECVAVESSADDVCRSLVAGPGDDDRTAVVVRFLPGAGMPAAVGESDDRDAKAARDLPKANPEEKEREKKAPAARRREKHLPLPSSLLRA